MTILIIGGGPTMFKYRNFLPCNNIWTVSILYPKIKCATLVFECHKKWSEGAYCARQDGKLITEIPLIDGHCYTSSFDYMLSHAIQVNATEINLCGVDLLTPDEAPQILGLEYMLGFCKASGVSIYRVR